MNDRTLKLISILALGFAVTVPSNAATGPAAEPEGIGIDQRLGSQLPLETEFTDEKGNQVTLGDLMKDRPAILVPVYYECPKLCSITTHQFVSGLSEVKFRPGEDFNVIVFSIDHEEGPAIARGDKKLALRLYAHDTGQDAWHFLTGDKDSVKSLTEALGFKYKYDEVEDQYYHPSTAVITTPEGRISSYIYGVEFPARDLELGLVEAGDSRIGSPLDQFLLLCYHYDPSTGRYGPIVMNVMRLAGTGTLLVMGVVGFSLSRKRKLNLGTATSNALPERTGRRGGSTDG